MGSTVADTTNIEIKDEATDKQTEEEIEDLEWSADQEILLLYSLHGYKPVGPNKHFRMLLIQDRLSSAMNKNISSKAIWKKLNCMYDLEALDEAEAEADALVAVETDFSLPEDEYGLLMADKMRELTVKIEKLDVDSESSDIQGIEALADIKTELDSLNENDIEKETSEMSKGAGSGKDRKEGSKRGPKKKDLALIKDNVPSKKDNLKDVNKKELQSKKETGKETKKGAIKEDEKKEFGKKTVQDLKKDSAKEDKKEVTPKSNKRELTDKKFAEQNKKDVEVKKSDPKKLVETQKNRVENAKPRAETPKQLRAETPKRAETKILRTEATKPQKAETPKLQKTEAVKKDTSAEKKKEIADKKGETKSPEKTAESGRGAKLRTREKKDAESERADTSAATKRERSRDSTSKASDISAEEAPTKKIKIANQKGRPTRNSIEPPQKPGSPLVNPLSPQKRRTRLM